MRWGVPVRTGRLERGPQARQPALRRRPGAARTATARHLGRGLRVGERLRQRTADQILAGAPSGRHERVARGQEREVRRVGGEHRRRPRQRREDGEQAEVRRGRASPFSPGDSPARSVAGSVVLRSGMSSEWGPDRVARTPGARGGHGPWSQVRRPCTFRAAPGRPVPHVHRAFRCPGAPRGSVGAGPPRPVAPHSRCGASPEADRLRPERPRGAAPVLDELRSASRLPGCRPFCGRHAAAAG
jgi:hypothetical protein